MKYKKVITTQNLHVQDLEGEAFEGVYLGTEKGKFLDDYLFFSKDRYFRIYGCTSLKQAMKDVTPGYGVTIEFKGEVKLKNDRVFLDTAVGVSPEEIPGFDVSGHLSLLNKNK